MHYLIKNPVGVIIYDMDQDCILQVVVEMPEFIKKVGGCMDEKSRNSFINYIAANPEAGEIMMGTGGARKIRWAGNSYAGKRGGVRVVYYYHDSSIPIFLFTVYPKNEKDNLSQADRNTLKSIIKKLVKTYEESL